MTIVEWDTHVNTKLYGQDGGYNDNTEKTSYKSGRETSYLKNSTPSKKHALKLSVDDAKKLDGKTEFAWFLYWYEITSACGTNFFNLADIITHSGTKTYRLSAPPTWTGQAKKEISISIEEV